MLSLFHIFTIQSQSAQSPVQSPVQSSVQSPVQLFSLANINANFSTNANFHQEMLVKFRFEEILDSTTLTEYSKMFYNLL